VTLQRVSVVAALLMALSLVSAGANNSPTSRQLNGTLAGNGQPLGNYRVVLYAAFNSDTGPQWQPLGNATSDAAGAFAISYPKLVFWPGDAPPALIVEAEHGPVMLASAIGHADAPPASVVVNERTTVATATSFAQFVHRSKVEGNTVGVGNAVSMAANFADPVSGDAGRIITSSPNAGETSTFATFNSLANVVASCIATEADCVSLFEAATPPDGSTPSNTFEAVANITKNPSFLNADGTLASDPLFALSQHAPLYTPALTAAPTSWLLFLKITGGFYSAQDSNNLMNGPGNFAIDARGNAWVLDNYVPEPPTSYACTGRRLIELAPSGANATGSPFIGGGLSGAGYGISFDPNGLLWIGNFGFQDPPCTSLPQAATNNSVSLFQQDGTPLSPAGGITEGNISWPQGTISDRKGNIWVASCGNDSITKFPHGDPSQATNIPLGAVPESGDPKIKPFGEVVDRKGNLWVTGNYTDSMYVVSPHGDVDVLPGTVGGRTVLSHPVGNAVDSKGNVWVSNSDWLDVPCPTATRVGAGTNPSITVYKEGRRKPYHGAPFTGGGLTVPWGIAVDGKDTVWVFNFGSVPVGRKSTAPTGISHFCGMDVRNCPAGLHTGDPISPSTGYQSDSLVRITGGQIDPSGNIWLTGNWKIDAIPTLNPGGNSVVIAVGAAAPVQTPLIGPPVPFQRRHH
jgi:hypothetical protein